MTQQAPPPPPPPEQQSTTTQPQPQPHPAGLPKVALRRPSHPHGRAGTLHAAPSVNQILLARAPAFPPSAPAAGGEALGQPHRQSGLEERDLTLGKAADPVGIEVRADDVMA